jgi:hypothetical protein
MGFYSGSIRPGMEASEAVMPGTLGLTAFRTGYGPVSRVPPIRSDAADGTRPIQAERNAP